MQTTLAAFISRSKAASTSSLCIKEGSGDESELKAIWSLYYPLYCHLIKGSEDTSRNLSEKKF